VPERCHHRPGGTQRRRQVHGCSGVLSTETSSPQQGTGPLGRAKAVLRARAPEARVRHGPGPDVPASASFSTRLTVREAPGPLAACAWLRAPSPPRGATRSPAASCNPDVAEDHEVERAAWPAWGFEHRGRHRRPGAHASRSDSAAWWRFRAGPRPRIPRCSCWTEPFSGLNPPMSAAAVAGPWRTSTRRRTSRLVLGEPRPSEVVFGLSERVVPSSGLRTLVASSRTGDSRRDTA
jgi:hypothetical protein